MRSGAMDSILMFALPDLDSVLKVDINTQQSGPDRRKAVQR
jgi:hypothetical protein